MQQICEGMAALDMEAVRKSKVNWFEVQRSWPALTFFSTAYSKLSSILEKGQSSSSKRALAAYDTPPNQTTIPADPTYSHQSKSSKHSIDTISSGDSKRENYTQLFADSFITASLTVFQLYSGTTISWLDPVYEFALSSR